MHRDQATLTAAGPSSLFESDVRGITIENLFCVWIAQLMENAVVDQNAQNIEVRFYRQGLNGFDFIYDGDGISDQALQKSLCVCMADREKNEIYKRRSMGYKGEAMKSLATSSRLTVITKHLDSEFAWRVEYGKDGQISNIQKSNEIQTEGTII